MNKISDVICFTERDQRICSVNFSVYGADFCFYLVGVPVRKNYFMSGCKCFDLFLKLAVAEGNRGAGRDVQRRIGMKSDTLENGAEDRRLRNIEISVII